MADATEDEVQAKPAKSGGGSQLIVLVLAIVVTVLGSIGGAIFWLMKTNRLPVQNGSGPVTIVVAKPEPVKTRVMMLEPLLVNLADPGGSGYLRVVMAVRVEDPPPPKDAKPKEEKPAEKGKTPVNEDEVRLRDVALTVLGRETSEHLLEPDGKEQLKAELKKKFVEELPELKTVDILFTEFLVQR